jgi:hypothetical protein
MGIFRGRAAWSLAFFVFPATLAAQVPATQPQTPAPERVPQPKRNIVEDVWETAYLDGFRVGFMHLIVEEFTRADGGKILHAARELDLTVRRGPDVARIQAMTGTDETPQGQVVGVFMKQGLAAQVVQEVAGKVVGDKLLLEARGGQAFKKEVPWDPRVVGTYGEDHLIRQKKPKPGDKFDYRLFEPIVNAIVTVRVSVDDFEQVLIGQQRQKLLRITAVPDEIEGVQLPGQILWVDDAFNIRRSTTVMPGLGFLVVDRTTREDATRPPNPNQLPDLMERQSIKLNMRMPYPHQRSIIKYRITLQNDKDPSKAFAVDDRQSVENVQGNTFDLTVTARRQPPTVAAAANNPPGAEFSESNYFITSDDENVKKHAAAAVGAEADPWRKAQLIERYVNTHMKAQNFSEAMAPASEVARTLTGDCTEYSMLAAAMCRAAGVPSRTAIGLVYVDAAAPRPPMLAFHMWTEVYVRGQWVAIDATLGQGSVGPGHVKITDASWHNTRSMKPLLPVMRVMIGRPAVALVEAR